MKASEQIETPKCYLCGHGLPLAAYWHKPKPDMCSSCYRLYSEIIHTKDTTP